LAPNIVFFGEMAVFPDDIGGLRCSFEVKMLTEYLMFLIIWQFFVLFSYFNCQKECVFLFKSNKSSSWSGQSLPVLNNCLDFLFFCPNFIELKERDVSSSRFQALY
jgi:hypothetical protein